ncbi:MAG: hypothetical protein LBD73_03735 [Deferribacteraceae bacterium]|jgi:hypothetical protein|nr:hypothetical protein [Deferribacteraceae bacterium]
MNLNETALVKTLSQLGGVHKRNLVLLLAVPVLFYFLYSDISGSILRYASTQAAPAGVDRVKAQIDRSSGIYDILKNVIVDYKSTYIFAGLVNEYLAKYFTPPPPPPPPVVIAPPRAPSILGRASAARKPVLPRKISEYKFTLSMIAWSKGHAYVVIDDNILREGQKTSAGLLVNRIEKNRVLLSNKWSSEWVTLNF